MSSAKEGARMGVDVYLGRRWDDADQHREAPPHPDELHFTHRAYTVFLDLLAAWCGVGRFWEARNGPGAGASVDPVPAEPDDPIWLFLDGDGDEWPPAMCGAVAERLEGLLRAGGPPPFDFTDWAGESTPGGAVGALARLMRAAEREQRPLVVSS